MARKKSSDEQSSSSDKKAVKIASKNTTKVEKPVVKVETKPGSLSVPVLSLVGVTVGTLSLPKEIFGEKVNKALLAQAIRVYSTNAQSHHAHSKTRGEINMTTKKWFRQKGTGNARHGAKSAPIFVKGGVALGPRARKVVLDLPKKMKKSALISALASKVELGEIMGLDGLDQATGKTKEMASLMKGLEKKSVLIVNDQKSAHIARAIRNLPGINFLTVDQLNAFEVIKHQSLLLTKTAVERLQSGNSAQSAASATTQPEVELAKKTVAKARRAK